MADWTSSAQHSFEYCEVDPTSWMDKRRLTQITSCSITRDISHETLGNASYEAHELPVGEFYVRTYFTPTQNGLKERYPLGTFLVQTPGKKWNGRVASYSWDAYTPLLELKGDKPPLGYTVRKNNNVMDTVAALIADNSRLPFVPVQDSTMLEFDFTAEGGDTWLSFISSLMAKAKYSFNLDELGVTYFEKQQEVAALTPLWTYTDDNSSIIYPDISFDNDIYGVPNVVEVVYTNDGANMYSRVVNDLATSPISTVSRGRVVLYREENPDFGGIPLQEELDIYAENLLETQSTIESKLTYSHGYNGIRLYDGVRLHHQRAEMLNVKARVVSQKLNCTTGLKVDETATFTNRLWEVK